MFWLVPSVAIPPDDTIWTNGRFFPTLLPLFQPWPTDLVYHYQKNISTSLQQNGS